MNDWADDQKRVFKKKKRIHFLDMIEYINIINIYRVTSGLTRNPADSLLQQAQ